MVRLQVSQLSFQYEQNVETELLLRDINFDLKLGDRVCILGKNGSGKSTLLKLISWLIPSKSNTILLNDHIRPRTNHFKRMVAYIPDKPLVYDALTGLEHKELIRSLWGIQKEGKALYEEKFQDLCCFFDLTHALEMPVKHYSLGMKYKLFLNCMLARSPELVILDEPFTSLDETSQKQSISMLTSAFSEKCILFTSHQRYLYTELGNRFFQLDDGNLKEIEHL
ncbi:ABC-transporter ATP-binding protein [Paenibacillus larvae subsp. larvae]|uniref:ABC-transporter ATP-binding protein n=2 Tax=Paenibacillus larvae TaxID=1464 RepID=A0A2L1U986_9BACL|nr:ABC transporter ATP-binding protein [Paenibacillus larvae]AQT85403.1 ABC transporter [Paenibacillus larvae subsp. pulvifaciens]AQZ47403.1 ABC transporter [Paenibacillus larvae subsp. pulvifaciens]AVF24729.1 ABC-transporter ATP-binding protein [Paenibacillus larvae subsp. larvae]AVF29490.1 ABC-transporter ATP-binding protein [Paenibacillus larvae subsp. larvae]MBH0344697.1 ABC transporter [Paenibacillus larvae]